jgi:hypothetical protein
MIYLTSIPEVAYAKVNGEIVAKWFPPKGMFFKFQVLELEGEMTIEELKGKLLVSEKPVYLTKEEILENRKKYRQG